MNHPLVSDMVSGLVGSEILKISGEIQQLLKSGNKIANFTVGDFDPRYFPIPTQLQDELLKAIKNHHTNYPPSSGMQVLRDAVANFYSKEFDLPTRSSEVLIAGGARPLIYSTFIALLNPGDRVLYPVPSWNNNHYAHLSGCEGIAINASAEHNFMPTAADIEPHIRGARLLCLNSPLNPTGTVFSKEGLSDICQLVLSENRRREKLGERALYLMYDQIYFKILHHGARHQNPLNLCPELKEYTIFIDGISKYFCGTGLRVGWSIIPEKIFASFSSLLGHIGAWAPKPEQVAVAEFLNNPAAIESFLKDLHLRLAKRIDPLYEGLLSLEKRGYDIQVVQPQGGIYLSVRIPTRKGLETNEQIRKALLEKAGIAVVPFQAFGLKEESGWFRFSVGAVHEDDIPFTLDKLEQFLKGL